MSEKFCSGQSPLSYDGKVLRNVRIAKSCTSEAPNNANLPVGIMTVKIYSVRHSVWSAKDLQRSSFQAVELLSDTSAAKATGSAASVETPKLALVSMRTEHPRDKQEASLRSS